MHFYSQRQETVLQEIKATDRGLSAEEAALRLRQRGENVLQEGKRKSPLLMFLEQFKDFMTILLMIAAAISAVIAFLTKDRSEVVDTIILLFIILLNNVIGFIQQYRADTAIQKMKQLSASYSKVLRNGKDVKIESKYLVPGDIVTLEEGDRVSADCRILSCKNLQCNESALTGESQPVEKSECVLSDAVPLAERKNMLYSSTYVTRGQAVAVVVETGMGTEIGRIASMINQAEVIQTPLERALDRLGRVISYLVVGIAAFIFVFGIFFRDVGLLPNFMSSVAVAVAAIPEGLPAVVTILMALGVQRMSAQRAIIRKLQAVETLGGCECICTDKTGTLTQNKMSVQEVCDYGNTLRMACCMRYCNTVKGKENAWMGDATEVALVRYVQKKGYSLPAGEKTDEIPFDSDRKRMSVSIRHPNEQMIYAKGGVEVLLQCCTHFSDQGEVRPLTEADRRSILRKSEEMASRALRVLGFACRAGEGELREERLVFLGLCGMMDPPKEGTREAVQTCQGAGITMVMITGDQKDTALAIARRLGIASSFSELMTGEELDALQGEALERRVCASRVFARVSPKHKSLIVEILQRNGKTVAMTGDGVNDAPSIKRAEIGIAMGSGTDVTKSVSDMVIADDNFSTIVTAVAEGRRIFANIRKTVSFFLTTNLGEVLSVLFVTLFLSRYAFLNSTQLLWINLITDSFPVLAMGVEKAERDSMQRPPKRAEREMFSWSFLLPVLCFGILQAIFVIGVFLYFLETSDNATALTAALFVMSFLELFHAFNVRTERTSLLGREFFANKVLLVTVILGVAVNLLLCVLEPVRAAFGIVPLTLPQWGIVFAVSLSILPLGELYKWILRRTSGKIKKTKKPIAPSVWASFAE